MLAVVEQNKAVEIPLINNISPLVKRLNTNFKSYLFFIASEKNLFKTFLVTEIFPLRIAKLKLLQIISSTYKSIFHFYALISQETSIRYTVELLQIN